MKLDGYIEIDGKKINYKKRQIDIDNNYEIDTTEPIELWGRISKVANKIADKFSLWQGYYSSHDSLLGKKPEKVEKMVSKIEDKYNSLIEENEEIKEKEAELIKLEQTQKILEKYIESNKKNVEFTKNSNAENADVEIAKLTGEIDTMSAELDKNIVKQKEIKEEIERIKEELKPRDYDKKINLREANRQWEEAKQKKFAKAAPKEEEKEELKIVQTPEEAKMVEEIKEELKQPVVEEEYEIPVPVIENVDGETIDEIQAGDPVVAAEEVEAIINGENEMKEEPVQETVEPEELEEETVEPEEIVEEAKVEEVKEEVNENEDKKIEFKYFDFNLSDSPEGKQLMQALSKFIASSQNEFNNELKKQEMAHLQELAFMENEKREIENKNQELQENVNVAYEKITEVTNQRNYAQQESDEKDAQIDSLTNHIKNVEEENVKLKEDKENSNEQIEDQKKTISELQEDLMTEKELKESAEVKAKAAEGEKLIWAKRYEEISQRNKNYSSETEVSKKQAQDLKDMLSQTNKAKNELKKDNDMLSQDNHALKAMVDNKNSQIEALKAEKEQQQVESAKEIASLKSSLSDAKSEMNELRRMIYSLKEEVTEAKAYKERFSEITRVMGINTESENEVENNKTM